jgi:O-antigen ligase
MRSSDLKRLFYITTLSGTAFCLPVSIWLLSLFTILTFISWILNGGFIKVKLLTGEKKEILIFFSIYLVYLIWMLNTSDTRTGFTELRLKLPLLLFPLVTGLSSPIEGKELRIIITSFISGVIVSSAYGVLTGADLVFSGLADTRTLSPFISHIRLALMAVAGIFFCVWYVFCLPAGSKWKFFFIISGTWMTIYLFLLVSVTGILVFLMILVVSAYLYIYRSGSKLLKTLFPVVIVFALLISSFFIYSEIRSFYKPGNYYSMPSDSITSGGNKYTNFISRKDIENGNRVWIYLCEDELRKEWNKRSSIRYDSSDKAGQELRFTLIRYMTSAGLKKDSAGMSMLGDTDIKNVERGMTNKNFPVWSPVKKKIYEIIWQIDYYRNGGNPSRHSITQRIEFLKTGWQIFLSAPLLGTGTGDLVSAYSSQYTKNNSSLEPEFRLLCHNQFLTFLVSFGIIGTVIICLALFYPFIKVRGYMSYPATVFFIIVILSMLGEDTLETHTGITFFVYFYSVFIFGTVGYETKGLS